jgi:hypothetical protein
MHKSDLAFKRDLLFAMGFVHLPLFLRKCFANEDLPHFLKYSMDQR